METHSCGFKKDQIYPGFLEFQTKIIYPIIEQYFKTEKTMHATKLLLDSIYNAYAKTTDDAHKEGTGTVKLTLNSVPLTIDLTYGGPETKYKEPIEKLLRPFIFIGYCLDHDMPLYTFLSPLMTQINKHSNAYLNQLPPKLRNNVVSLMRMNVQILKVMPKTLLNTQSGLKILERRYFAENFAKLCVKQEQLLITTGYVIQSIKKDGQPIEAKKNTAFIYTQINKEVKRAYEEMEPSSIEISPLDKYFLRAKSMQRAQYNALSNF